jgi:cysteinyl-tRNA synthetase
MFHTGKQIVLLALCLLFGAAGCAAMPVETTKTAVYENEQTPAAAPALAAVTRWVYYLGFEPDDAALRQMAASDYDLIVIEPIFTDRENQDFPMAQVIAGLHNSDQPKQVVAYIDIGQAEDWRDYWQPGWGVGRPEWIIANDPDGWEGNYPVAFWHEEWQNIWLEPQNGYLQRLLDAGFDGVYLDWVEAYSDENVMAAAAAAGVDPEVEMVEWVRRLGDYGRTRSPDFLVIAQNSAELVENDTYVSLIDGLAQEQTWFDGAADNNPPGDCPLPATDADVDTPAYYNALSPGCQRLYAEFPDSTLHVSSDSYLYYLTMARDKGLPVFTIDYAVQPDNVSWIYATSRRHGFIPFTSERALDSLP